MSLRHAHSIATLLVALATSSASASAQTSPALEGRFLAETSSPFAVAGAFAGTYRVFDDRVEVTIPNASLFVRPNCPYRGRSRVVSLRVALAEPVRQGEARWRRTHHSDAVAVDRVMVPGDQVQMDQVRVSIPLEPGVDLANSWIVITLEVQALDIEDQRGGETHAHTARDLFVRSARPDEPRQVGAPGLGVDAVAWLQGCWAFTRGERTVEEHWMAPRGDNMVGTSRTVAGGVLRGFELIVLRVRDGRLAYQAHPSGQPSAEFLSTMVGDNEVVFENLQHDFPQRIGYRGVGTDQLQAWIEGPRQGQTRRIEFPYRRIPCAGAR